MPRGDRPRRRGTPLRWVLGGIAAVLVAWIVASGILLFEARDDAGRGLDRLERDRSQLDAAGVLTGTAAEVLRNAQHDFDAAQAHASSPVLAPWSVVPLASQNVGAVKALTAAAARVAGTGERAAREATRALAAPAATPAERLAVLRELQDVVARARRSLRRVDLGSDFFLASPIGDARKRFVERLTTLRDSLADSEAVTRAAQRLLEGPRRYLVIAANNAEMRAGSGMFHSLGEVNFSGGSFTVTPPAPSAAFNLPAGAVALPPEQEQLWGWAHPTQEWRNLATTPRFDVSGSLAAQMWQAATGHPVDGVLAVDPIGLQAILAAQGPIDVGGRVLDAANVASFLFQDQYQGATATDAAQVERRDQLGLVALAVVDTLQSRPWQTGALVTDLSAAGKARHVLAWAKDPTEQRAWEAGGIAGELHDDSLAVNILNTGANKLDQFLEVDARLRVRQVADGGHEATITVRVRNNAPSGLPGYVSGPDPRVPGLAEGEYQGILGVNGPGVGSVATISPWRIEAPGAAAQPVPAPVLVGGRDGPTKATAVGGLRLPRGATAVATVRIRLPEGFDGVTVEPSARNPAIIWHFGDKTWQDVQAERQEW